LRKEFFVSGETALVGCVQYLKASKLIVLKAVPPPEWHFISAGMFNDERIME